MKSSDGKYFPALDHVRAVAAFMVFSWHFVHGPVPLEGAPLIFPLALLDEGHTGVSLFMVLSGYLFAKLLDGREITYRLFFWNRFIRLAPLLLFVFFLTGLQQTLEGDPLPPYLTELIEGFIYPTWPSGGWSITIEMHFYILLPFLLYFTRRWKPTPLVALAFAVALRSAIFAYNGSIEHLAYMTIAGHIDQFLMGIAAFNYRDTFKKNHLLVAFIATAFCAFWWWLDQFGGYYGRPNQLGALWIIIPTVEAVCYSIIVAYYDNSFSPSDSKISWALAKIGTYSYSIYLLHIFFYAHMIFFLQDHVMDISNFYVAVCWAVLGFSLMIPIGYLSYRFVEEPFLGLRRSYIKPAKIGDEQIFETVQEPSVRPKGNA
jgi:peptidoglycan/LPS O-acetylase OafA/YrhL